MPDASHPAPDSKGPDPTHRLLGPGGDMLDDVEPTERSIRLQALLSQWLRMENVVVLLGAGASTTQGGPLMGDLERYALSAARELCKSDDNLKTCLPLPERLLLVFAKDVRH
jgi:hypothetical protein